MTLWSKVRKYLSSGKIEVEVDYTQEGRRHEAEKAKENALLNLQEVRQTSAEIAKVTGSLRELRNRNHFGEAIQLAMLARRKG